ncbi:MAG: hypothetical protein ACTSUJ_07970 [Candidatus Njordarchaeales archaeon]
MRNIVLPTVLVFMLALSILAYTPVQSQKKHTFINSVKTSVFVLYTRDLDIPRANLSLFLQKINESGYELREANRIFDYSPLERVDALLILGSKNLDFLDQELIVQFLKEGGSLLIAFPTSNASEYNNFILKYFPYRLKGIIKDNSSYYTNFSEVIINNTAFLRDSPLIRNLTKLIIPNGWGLIRENITANFTLPYNAYALIWGLNSTFIDENNNDYLDKGEISGQNVTCILIIELYSGGKIIILPSVKMLSNEILSNPLFHNKILAFRIIDWLGGRYASIRIKNIQLSTNYVRLDQKNKSITVTFIVVDENDEPVENISSWVCITRLGIIVANVTPEQINQTSYRAIIDFSNIRVSQGIVYLIILVYKQYYGYYWSSPVAIHIYKSPIPTQGVDYVLLLLGFVVPIFIGLALVATAYPEYRRKKKKLKEIYQKIS